MTAATHLLLVGPNDCARAPAWEGAVREAGATMSRVDYADVVQRPELLAAEVEARTASNDVVWLRLESPGPEGPLSRALRGLAPSSELPEGAECLDAAELGGVVFERGEARALAQLGLGYHQLLERIDAALCAAAGLRVATPPKTTMTLMDKVACRAKLVRALVPVPAGLPTPASFDVLMQQLSHRRGRGVFIKSRWGSSAGGQLALRVQGGRVQAFTTLTPGVGADSGRWFNTRRVRGLSDMHDIARRADYLLSEGAYVERWVPKMADARGRAFDVRVVTVAGEPSHVLTRIGRGPMTNLHLGGQRADEVWLRERVGPERFEDVLELSRKVARCFSSALMLGVDVLVPARGGAPLVCEVNAFGDFLPGLRSRGLSTYEAQVRSMVAA